MTATLSTDSAERKEVPMARGVLDYFPAALAEVAKLSKIGNDKHNPGEDLHWARGKSMDHADCILRHLVERGTIDTDGLSHTVKVVWRALALLQEELEAKGAPMARGARISRVVVIDPAPAPPTPVERAWNEGWKCGCGSTEVWFHYDGPQDERLLRAKACGVGPMCASDSCVKRMTRV